ncbi:MAG: LCP family protein [Actinomycetota bacterium]
MAEAASSEVTRIPGRGRALAAAAMSLVVPGTGQWFAGRRRRALPFLAVSAVLAVVVVVGAARGEVFALRLLVQPRWLTALIVLNVAVGLFRLAASIDAYRVAAVGTPAGSAVLHGAVAGLLVIVLLVPHVLLGARASRLLELLDRVFAEDSRITTEELRARFSTEAARSAGAIPGVTSSTTVPGWALFPQYPDGLPRPVRTYYGEVADAEIEPIEVDRMTVLLVGGDAGPGRSGLRTDVMILASFDPVTHEAVLISISRELTGFLLPRSLQKPLEWRQDTIWSLAERAEANGTSRATDPLPDERDPALWLDRINAIYPFSYTFDWLYPGGVDPGMEALRETLQRTLGLRIDFYVLVDFAGFVDVVDAIGGVDVTARESMHVRFSPAKAGEEDTIINILPGRNHLDGRTALAYVRNRSDSNDVVRTRRQRCLIREVAAQLDPLTVLFNFDAIATAIENHTTTNLPLRLLPDLITAVAQLNPSEIGTWAIQGVSSLAPKSDYHGLPILDVTETRRQLAAVLAGVDSGTPIVDADECG